MLQWYWCMYVFLCLLFLLRTTPHITLTNTNHIRELRISKILPIGFGTSSIQEKYHCYVVFKWYCQFSGYSRVLVVVCLIVFPRLLFKSMLQLFCRLNDTSLETLSSLSGLFSKQKWQQFSPKIWRLPSAKSARSAFSGKWPSIESAIGQEWAIVADFNLNQI